MRKSVLALALAPAALAVAACSNDTGTFKDETENFIEDEDGEISEAQQTVFSDAECEEPESIDVGTTYTCTAVDEEGTTYVFDVEIDGENTFTVVPGVPQDG